MFILIFQGILFGPILGVFNPTAVKSFTLVYAALAIAYLLFDGSIGLNLQNFFSSPKAVLLVLGFCF